MKTTNCEIPEGSVPLLDHGYLLYVDRMGTDADVAAAARLSYGRGTTKVNKDEGLINYLYKNAHTSPFEMVEMKFQMRLPIFVMRQLVRHRTANLNEYSGRYSEMPELWYVPKLEQIKAQHTVNKQGSGETLPQHTAIQIQQTIDTSAIQAFADYQALLDMGLSRESARIVLPLNTYTEVVWKMDLNNLLKFLILRDDEHAQWEIQVYARCIAQYVELYYPQTYAAYMKRRESLTFTQEQLLALFTGNYNGLPKSDVEFLANVQRNLQQRITAEMAK